jgi:hypothetical protein
MPPELLWSTSCLAVHWVSKADATPPQLESRVRTQWGTRWDAASHPIAEKWTARSIPSSDRSVLESQCSLNAYQRSLPQRGGSDVDNYVTPGRARAVQTQQDHLVPLMSEAAFKGDVPTMQRLVVKGASVNQHDQVSTPPSLPSPRRTPHCSLLPRAGLSHSPPCRVGLNWIGWV